MSLLCDPLVKPLVEVTRINGSCHRETVQFLIRKDTGEFLKCAFDGSRFDCKTCFYKLGGVRF
jgi:hypothetical protein